MAITKSITLVYSEITDTERGHNKVWIGELHDDDTVITKWGRIGDSMQSKSFPSAGESFLLKKEKEKLKKGYTPAKTIGEVSAGATTTVASSNLAAIAREQLAKNHPQLSALVDRLVKANIHNITSQTNITYNSATGLFQTPLGAVMQEGIDEARGMLVEVKKALVNKKTNDLKSLVAKYLRIIPQKVGRMSVENVFPDLDAVEKQSDILDSLESTLSSMTTAKPVKADGKTDKLEQIFDAELDILKDAREQRRLEDVYHRSMKSMHGYGHVKIRQIFTAKVTEMDSKFDKILGNVVEVYHGTSQSNLLSILKSGIKTSPPNTAYIAGKMFGNGIYGAINSSKSLGYTFGRWGGSSGGDSGWLFVCDFAMGKVHEPTSTCQRPASGCDSVWAKAHKVGLNHDELVVYRNNQCRIKYLLECK